MGSHVQVHGHLFKIRKVDIAINCERRFSFRENIELIKFQLAVYYFNRFVVKTKIHGCHRQSQTDTVQNDFSI